MEKKLSLNSEELSGEWTTVGSKKKEKPKKVRKAKGNFHKMRAAIDPELKEEWIRYLSVLNTTKHPRGNKKSNFRAR